MEENSNALIADEGGEEREFVEEGSEILQIVQRVIATEGKDAEQVYDRWKQILYKYQEQSQLLDAFLEDIVVPLSSLLRQHAVESEAKDSELQKIQGTCRMLSVLVVVRGYKTVVKFFPHEAQDLEKVLMVFTTVKARSKVVKTEEEAVAVWESQSILLLWLSMLILVPFDLATIDSSATDMTAARSQPYTQLVSKIMTICQECLHQPGSVREMGALLLGRMLTRPDMGLALGEYIAWTEGALTSVSDIAAPFLLPGVLHSLCFIFKLGQRARLLPHTHKVWKLLMGPLVTGSAVAGSSALARKLSVKLLQRLALTFLEPRLASWRYQRDAGGDLEQTLQGGQMKREEEAGRGISSTLGDPKETDIPSGEEEEDYEIAEEIEEVVEMLLTGLRDKDTIVRWSVAKGVGRVTGCLPQELADEVVAQVLQLFRPTESDAAWHGGCLALAELARRGLLLPHRLPTVTPIVQMALAYDVRRGPHSIGAHVRDAAAYVCWACARAYEPSLLTDSVQVLASSLLVGACYDREVNCRRAAAAAFQEAVGRLGNFPHGMDIIAVADYFAVGNITQAYTRVAPFISGFPEYRLPLAAHLVHIKLKHWEKGLRELAARACAALVPAFGEYFCGEALDVLLPLCLDPVLEVRHGALMGITELLPALKAAGFEISLERKSQVAGLVPAIDKARLYRGKGGEVMREAVGKLIASMSKVGLPLSKLQNSKVMDCLDENLRHPQPYIQSAAVEGLKHYTKAYIQGMPEACAVFSEKQMGAYMTRLHDPNVAVRRGYSAALGCLPSGLLQPAAIKVIDALIDGMRPEEAAQDRDVDSRVSCTRALGSVCSTLYGGTDKGSDDFSMTPQTASQAMALLIQKVLPALHEAIGDYTTDNRGDVGSWIRDAAMEVMVQVTQWMVRWCGVMTKQGLIEEPDGVLLSQVQTSVGSIVAVLLKQAVERIGRIREAAMRHLRSLVMSMPTWARGLVPAVEEVERCFYDHAALDTTSMLTEKEGPQASTRATSFIEVVPQLVALLRVPQYTGPLLEGLIASIGGIDASLSKTVSSALVEVLISRAGCNAPSLQLLAHVAQQLVEIWSRHAKSARMAIPLLRCTDLLVTQTEVLTQAVQVRKHQPTSLPKDGESRAPVDPSQPASQEPAPVPFTEVVVELARAETRLCTDVARLLVASSLLCHLLACPNPCQASAVAGLLVLLVNKYPTVRRHTAEQLYLQLLTMEAVQLLGSASPSAAAGLVGASIDNCSVAVSEEDMDQTQEVLLQTTWDGELDQAKAARDMLSKLLKVPVPAMKLSSKPDSLHSSAVVRDENASYNALISDVSRGL